VVRFNKEKEEETIKLPSLLLSKNDEYLMRTEDLNLLASLLAMESQYRRVSLSVAEVPKSYFEQFKTLEDLLSSEKNLLNIAHKFTVNLRKFRE
jgi:hypothetical protein